jgi:glycosyltransferase involved in cell wall biosynthesis
VLPGSHPSAAGRRLLAVAAVDHPGGAETTLLRLLSRLHDRGWQITLTTPGLGPLRDAALDGGLDWEPLAVGGLARGAGAMAVAAWRRARRLAAEAEVVYLNGAVCGRLLPALPSGRARRVLHIHDLVKRVPRFWRRADLVLAASGAVAGRLEGLAAHVVYGPVEDAPAAVDPPWPSRPGALIGFVGRVEPRKGPLDLVRAIPAIRRQLPDARVVVVGDDPYHTDPAYTQAVLSSPEIETYPWSGNAPGLMRHLDVLVLPSYDEPFGTVLAEAMAVGTPVVAGAVDGLPEVVDDGVTGRLVTPGDPDSIAAAVLEVLSRQAEMGAAARRHARRFATETYCAHVEELIGSRLA